ncbi:6-phosphogluconolactonase [Candidatus Peribacteria bacterium RIFCSPLOWO2_12_FULL_55_15]|nr:MAG: 6-phosphogluconolactonase [Candidatus Peribacteria bacterium RIFCSPHIGHO2_02_FULL_55_24]OGJ68919.1 MAG: 6-phosphogluconolactonase [Candidatus Peribacteria bacterium RIFCSPLOWO2_01_FULL_54_110]OGJ70471.1 MAG: 6-phosphogluconolactonase [Candidatus Peribacteria bacterium RIFCSPLOWO2_12_FULL_55_15]
MTARFLIEQMQTAQRDHGTCIVGLSGGSTPRLMYEEIGKALRMALHPNPLPPLGHELVARDPEGFSDPERGVEWRGEGIHIFLVDERYVPPDHPESNQRMVRETLLQHLPLPEKNLTFPNTNLQIDACVADYARRLKALWKYRLPDLIILGMGTDGHIASLFPPLSDLALGDTCLVLHTRAPEGIGPPDARDRITLSLNAICAADKQVLLLQGEEKKRAWEEMLSPLSCRSGRGDGGEGQWPLKRVIATGNLTVIGPATATA